MLLVVFLELSTMIAVIMALYGGVICVISRGN
jgi:hypothetical protein